MAIINLKYNYAFLCTPKTASTSIENALKKQHDGWIETESKHCHTNCILSKLDYDMGLYMKLKRFAVIRNPYDMAVSAYFYTFNTVPDKHRYSAKKTFSEYLRDSYGFIQMITVANNILFDARGNGLDEYIEYKNIQSNINLFLSSINAPSVSIEILNKTKHREDYRKMYNEEDYNYITEICKPIIKLGSYKF